MYARTRNNLDLALPLIYRARISLWMHGGRRPLGSHFLRPLHNLVCLGYTHRSWSVQAVGGGVMHQEMGPTFTGGIIVARKRSTGAN